MSLLHGKQLRDQSLSLDKVSGVNGLVTFTSSATMSFEAGTTLRQADENIIIGIDVVNKNYVDAVAQGLHVKEAVAVISQTASIALSGDGFQIDGWTVSTGDRVLVNAQAGVGVATASNGIYVVATSSWTRALDSDGNPTREVSEGDFVFVRHGDTYETTGWVLSTTDAVDHYDIQVGTESQLWTQFSSAGVINAGAGLFQTGIDINVGAGTGITVNANDVAVNFTVVAETLQGNGLSASGGVLNIGAGTGITVNNDNIEVDFTAVASGLDGAGLSANGTELEVNTGLGLTISSDAVAMVWGGTASGTTFSNNAIGVNVDGVTLIINSSGQLEATTQGDIQGVTAGAGLTGGGSSGFITLDVQTINGIQIISDSVGLGGTLSQDTTINGDGGSYSLTVGNVDNFLVTASSSFDVSVDDGLIILDAGDGGSVDIYGGDVLIFATGSIDMTSTEQFNIQTVDYDLNFTGFGTVSVGGSTAGLVYSATPSNSLPLTLIHKQYVDDAVSNLGSGTINGVTAGNGLSGGGTANYITLDVNLGVNSGLTFSGDDIIIDTNISGDGLSLVDGVLNVNTGLGLTISADTVAIDFGGITGDGLTQSGGVISVNYTTISSTIAGDGLTSSGSVLDVQVDTSGLNINGSNQVALNSTITGDRTFSDSVTINGNLIVNGTTSVINTENLFVEDNIITINATYSGPPIAYSGIEINVGDGTYSTLLWEGTTGYWIAGASGSENYVVTQAGNGLTQSFDTLSLDFTSVAESLQGNGLSASGGVINIIAGTGISVDDNSVSVDFVSITGDGLTQSGGVISLSYSSVASSLQGNGLTANNGVLDVNAGNGLQVSNDVVVLGGTLSQNTTISGGVYDLTINNFDGSSTASISISDNLVYIESTNGISQGYIDVTDISASIYTGTAGQNNSIELFAYDDSVTDGSTNNRMIVTDDANSKGLVYAQDYTANFTTYSLITKGYVDNAIASNNTGVTSITAGAGLTATGTTGSVTLNIGAGSGIAVNADDVAVDYATVAQVMGGDGLTASGNTLTVGAGAGITVNADDIEISLASGSGLNTTSGLSIDSSAAGDGLSFTSGVFSVNTALGLTISSDNVGMVWGGTSSGLTFSSNAISANVDGTTIQVNSSGQLTVVAGASTPVYQFATSINQNAPAVNNFATGITISQTPNDYSRINIFVNGQLQRIGDAVTTTDCYFGTQSGSAIALSSIESGYELYWNAVISGFRLSNNDQIDIIYES